jgi:hypothetical protein
LTVAKAQGGQPRTSTSPDFLIFTAFWGSIQTYSLGLIALLYWDLVVQEYVVISLSAA